MGVGEKNQTQERKANVVQNLGEKGKEAGVQEVGRSFFDLGYELRVAQREGSSKGLSTEEVLSMSL